MEIRVLRYFLAVANEGSITGAAKSLHLTQPTLSRQLRDLEEKLGKKLLVRSNHNVTLTAEGRLLRQRAEDIINMVDKTTAEFSMMDNSICGDVYIGCTESDAIRLIAQVATEMKTRYPHIRYHLYSGYEDDVTDKLDNGLLDFGILLQPAGSYQNYNFINFPIKDVWGLLMRKDHPLAQKDFIQPTDLRDVPLIFSRQFLKKTLSRNDFREWLGDDEYEKLNIVATFNLFYNATLMVETGFCCMFSIDKLVRISDDSLLCFRPLKPKLESGLDIIWKNFRNLSPAASLFLKELQTSFEKISSR